MSSITPSEEAPSKNLLGVCRAISDHFGLKVGDVLEVAATNVALDGPMVGAPTSSTASGFSEPVPRLSSVSPTRTGSGPNLVALAEFAQLPQDKQIKDLTVAELTKYLQDAQSQNPDDSAENAVPFLLRHVLGEFHYGQRISRRLPGQKKEPDSSTPAGAAKTEIPKKKTTETDSKVFDAFDVLAKEAKFRHLHQVAGWVDLDDKAIWDNYVRDVIANKLRDGDRLFEAGCGVLAFLRSCQGLVNNLTIGGSDGAKKTIQVVQEQLVEPEFRDNFSAGMLPDSLESIPDNAWDVVCCNSVFQYLPDRDTAKVIVEGFIRIAKRWVIIADICDDKYNADTQDLKKGLGWTDTLPDYLCYPKSWWEDNFDLGQHLVSIRHVEVPTYKRRKQRYVVYIEKNAPVFETKS